MPAYVYTLEDVVLEQKATQELIKQSISIQEAILAKVSAVINVRVVEANAPPQYLGPTEIMDAVVGGQYALEGMDPDGDTITWSMDESTLASISPQGVLTWNAAGEGVLTVWLDDGKS